MEDDKPVVEKFIDLLRSIFANPRHTNLYFFLNIFIAWLVITLCFNFLSDEIPENIYSIFNTSVVILILFSIILNLISYNKKNDIYAYWKCSGIFLASVCVYFLLIYMIISVIPRDIVTMKDITEILERAQLNDNQVKQVHKILEDGKYITQQDIQTIGLNDEQIKQIKEFGFVDKDDVVDISRTEIAAYVTMMASEVTPEASNCFIEGYTRFSTVTIRKRPTITSSAVGYVMPGDRYHVIGHDGGEINIDRWWLIELQKVNDVKYGWVSSPYVKEINPGDCMQLQASSGGK